MEEALSVWKTEWVWVVGDTAMDIKDHSFILMGKWPSLCPLPRLGSEEWQKLIICTEYVYHIFFPLDIYSLKTILPQKLSLPRLATTCLLDLAVYYNPTSLFSCMKLSVFSVQLSITIRMLNFQGASVSPSESPVSSIYMSICLFFILWPPN